MAAQGGGSDSSCSLVFVPATRERRHVRHTPTIALDTVIADDDRAQNVFSGQGLAFSAGNLEGLGIVMHTGYRV